MSDDDKMQLKKYKKYIYSKIESGELDIFEFDNLVNKNLGCWCKPDPCHGDILLELLEEYLNCTNNIK